LPLFTLNAKSEQDSHKGHHDRQPTHSNLGAWYGRVHGDACNQELRIKIDRLEIAARPHAPVATRACNSPASLASQPKLKSVVDPQEQVTVSDPDMDRLPLIDSGRNKAIPFQAIRATAPVHLTRRGS
jgi:hypothetical protein